MSTWLALGCNRGAPSRPPPPVARDAAATPVTPSAPRDAAAADAPAVEGPTGAVEGTVRLNGRLGRFPAVALDSGTASRAGCRDAAERIYTNPFPIEAPGLMPEALVTVDARSAVRPPSRRRVVTFFDCSISPRVLVMSLNDQIVLHAETDEHPIPKVDGLGATIARMLFRGEDQEPVGLRRPGRYIIHSVIHPHWLQTPMLVTPNWFYDQTNREGRYRVAHLPPGTYTMHAWYPGTTEVTATVTITANGVATQDFTLTALPIERIAPLQPPEPRDAGPVIP
ncbi:MAG: carboxypeptidase-like regulatory domain-containing protein [Polyangiales bacterium]